MEPQSFVAEVYRRMARVASQDRRPPSSLDVFLTDNRLVSGYFRLNYAGLLPEDPSAPILDLGCSEGSFVAGVLDRGYTDVTGADLGTDHAAQIQGWGAKFEQVRGSIPAFLTERPGTYDLIHAAHLVEHIPKHDLLENLDAIYYGLRPGGRVVLVTPNMLSPVAMWSLYVTLGHEYGFSYSNLESLLSICGFDRVSTSSVSSAGSSPISRAARASLQLSARVRYRAYGLKSLPLASSILGTGVRPEVDPLPERVRAERHGDEEPEPA